MLAPRAILVCAIVALSGTVTSAGAAPQQTPPDQRGETTLRIGAATRPDSLNPLVADNRLGRAITSILYDEILPVDLDEQPLPGLVRKWTRSNDGRLWLLDLRAGARWSDGVPVTARDVVHTLKRIQDDPRSRFAPWLEGVARIDRFGRLRVGIRLDKPARTPPALPIPVLPRHIWESVQREDVADFANEPPIGSGAFTTNATTGDTLVLQARKKHWRDVGVVDTVELSFFDSQAGMAAALEASEIDVADDVESALLPRLSSAPDIDVRAIPATAFVSLGINTGSSAGNGSVALRQARVRRAIAQALDRDAIRKAVLGSYGETGSTIIPPGHPDHAKPRPGSELTFSPNRAALILDRAEIVDNDDDGTRELRPGKPFELRLYTRLASPETERIGELIATSLREIGIDVTVAALTDRELTKRIRRGRYDLFVWGWDAGGDPSFITSVLTCAETGPDGLSDTYFCDPDYEDMHQRFSAARNKAQRTSLLKGMQQRAYDRVPYVVLYYRPTFQAFRTDRFSGPADETLPLVFAETPADPVNLELLPGQAAAIAGSADPVTASEAAPTNDIVEEIRSSLLWQLLAAATIAVLLLLLVPRIIRGLVRLRRSRRSRRAEEDDGASTEPTNDEGRP